MILTKEQTEKRLSSQDNIVNRISDDRRESPEVIIKDGINHVGRPGSHNLTEEEKVIIGTSANLLGNEVTAELMGVSPTTAKHLKCAEITLSDGRGTQRSGTDLELKNKINNRLEATKLTIQERAAEKLLGAMGLLTEEKMENSSAKDLAQISNQMSQVVRNITPNSGKEKDDGKSKVQIIIHQPKQSREDLFDCIEVRSN